MILRLTVVVVDYMFEFSFSNHDLHLEGEEVFRSTKRPTDYPLGVNNDSYRLDHVNFSCPWIIVLAIQPNIVDDVGMQQLPSGSSAFLPLVSWGGLELKENICVDG